MKSDHIIQMLSDLGESLENQNQKKVIADTILEITRLNDENQSVWDLIEEMKSSDIKNYKKF